MHFAFAEGGDGKSKFGIEASGRGGAVRTDYSSADLRDYMGNWSEYDFTTPYYGAHAGLGWERSLGERWGLETYAKWMWTHQEGTVADVLGDAVEFDPVNSHRARAGLRLLMSPNDAFSLRAGAAYEYEFDGSVRARVHGVEFGVPDLTGGTGLFEAGLRFGLSEKVNVDLGGQGFVGKREGGAGMVRVMVGW